MNHFQKQARRVYEILRLRATNISNETDYRNYRLDVKRRLNIPYKREQNDMNKLEAALRGGSSGGSSGGGSGGSSGAGGSGSSSNNDKRLGIVLPKQEERIQLLEKEYRTLEEEYKKVIKRLDKEFES